MTIRFEVHDTGIGLAPGVRQRLFTPFVQADGSTTRRYGGTGLGLSICKRLVELMGGQIGFDSEEGQGSVFWFVIPLIESRSVVQLPALARASNQVIYHLGGTANTKAIVSSYVEAEGLVYRNATTIGGILYGLDTIVQDGMKCESILIDSASDTVEPLSAVDAIRRDHRYRRLNIVLLVDAHERELSEKAPERGANLCLFKPFLKTELMSALFLRRKETQKTTLQKTVAKRKVKAPIRILVVEDNALIRGLTVRQLEKFGIETDIATNGAEAVELTFTNDYSLLLMDCQMPVMDGFEATLEIRKRESVKGGHIPIVAMTAYAMSGDREQCVACGMDDYLSKPVTMDQLESMLEKWLSHVFSPTLHLGSHDRQDRKDKRHAAAEESGKPSKWPSGESGAGDAPAMSADAEGSRAISPIDISSIERHYGKNSVAEILKSFIDELNEILPALVIEVKRGELAGAARSAHQLKGLLSVLSAKEMSDLARSFEHACQDERRDDVAAMLTILLRSGEKLTKFINNYLLKN
jgi:CheY-like chemotaxis protein/HPt (histidine-containing phosphotransfer) domain-containing protein